MTEDFHNLDTVVDLLGVEEPPLAPLPKQIGPYKIESLLNRGGMSLLYLGIDPKTHEPLVIKVLSPAYVNHKEMVDRFMQEADIISLADHPNIVKIHGHGKWEGGVYIAMEFVQGITLRQLILQQALSLKRALEIVLQIAHALTHLHSHGIVHRDLKPENILLTATGGVKVIDFGIAQLHTDEGKKHFMGTPVYMSPEQKKSPKEVSFPTDIYSLGLVTYELILGRLSHGDIHLSLMPRGLHAILVKALKSEPKERFEDIIDFVKAISNYLSSEEIKRDMRGSDYLGELSENLKEAQALVIPKELPAWPRVSLGIASNSNTAISAVTYDFFEPKPGVYTIVMGEAIATGMQGLLTIASLRGQVRALAPLLSSPKELVETLNRRICEDYGELAYAFSLLHLFASEDRLSFISCGYSPLWHIPRGSEVPRSLTSETLALGIDPDMEVFEISANWNIGDSLVLHTFQAALASATAEIEQDERLFVKALKENLHLGPTQQAAAIFRKVSAADSGALFERPLTLICTQRTA